MSFRTDGAGNIALHTGDAAPEFDKKSSTLTGPDVGSGMPNVVAQPDGKLTASVGLGMPNVVALGGGAVGGCTGLTLVSDEGQSDSTGSVTVGAWNPSLEPPLVNGFCASGFFTSATGWGAPNVQNHHTDKYIMDNLGMLEFFQESHGSVNCPTTLSKDFAILGEFIALRKQVAELQQTVGQQQKLISQLLVRNALAETSIISKIISDKATN